MYILSDIHGEIQAVEDFIFGSKEKYCIQLGDFGLIFSENPSRAEDGVLDLLQSHLSKHDKFLFTVLGNHDCWPRYEILDEVSMFGAKCWKIRENIYAVIPGEILSVEDKTFLCIGGADSMDKDWRIDYAMTNGDNIWWPEEAITAEDIANAKKNLGKFGDKVDYVCTHCEPSTFSHKLFIHPIISKSESRLDEILAIADFEDWFGGHVHEDFTVVTGGKCITSLDINRHIIV